MVDSYNDSSFRILLWNTGIESNMRTVICEKIKPWTFAAEKGFLSVQDLNVGEADASGQNLPKLQELLKQLLFYYCVRLLDYG